MHSLYRLLAEQGTQVKICLIARTVLQLVKKNINNVLSFRQFSLQVGHRFFVDPLLMALRTLKYIIYSPVGFNHYVV